MIRYGCLFVVFTFYGLIQVFANAPAMVPGLFGLHNADSMKPVKKALSASVGIAHSFAGAVPVIGEYFPVNTLIKKHIALEGQLGFSKKGRPVPAYYFPGSSDKKALIIGGVHGSELSAIEIAKNVVDSLRKTASNYYHVIVIPCLFPDNELVAKLQTGKEKKWLNAGRYTTKLAIDPNRQMPTPGKAFDPGNPLDYKGRMIEEENQLLLQLINEYKPDRLVNLHAIRDVRRAGIFADPRTDYRGYALGFESDSSLAIEMAKFIYQKGGNVAGNQLDGIPSALYYLDPPIAPEGSRQPRSLELAERLEEKGQGVSLGTWASTAVCDSLRAVYNRPSMRVITVEFPGYRRAIDYPFDAEKSYYKDLTDLYTSAIHKIFLAPNFEEEAADPCLCKGSNPTDQ